MLGQSYPQKLSFSIGSFYGSRISLHWNGHELIYNTYVSGGGKYEQDQKTVVPEEAKWESFWIAVRNIGAWYWCEVYDDICVCDGIEWQLEFALAGKEVKSEGYGSYAPNGEQIPPEAFKQLLHAFGELMNDQKFIDDWYYEAWD